MFRNKHRRTQSDHSGPVGLSLSTTQKTPEARLSVGGRSVASPQPSCQTDISHPLAVDDPEKLEQLSKQKMNTMQMMYEQARRECEELKHEYQKKPTEMVHSVLEAKVKVVRRLESQLSMHGGDGDAQSGEKRVCRRGSSIESSQPVSEIEREISSRPPPMPSHAPKHKERHENDGAAGGGGGSGGARANKVKQEVHLTRSHSDSCKRISKETDRDRRRIVASVGEIQKFTVAASDDFETGSQPDNDSFGNSKSQDAASSESSDSALNHFGPASDPAFMPMTSEASDSSKQLSNIIALDDYEFNDSDDDYPDQCEDQGSPFNDFFVLKNRPAHLAVFLHYLISNSDASPLLFYLMSGQNFSTGTLKELRKWAYEIFSTFLVDKAVLKVKVDEAYIDAINDTLLTKFDKEESMRDLFVPAREKFVLPQIKELLADYRSKRALGLGAMFGENGLKEGMDPNSELKVVEVVLGKDFENAAADEDCERSQVVASVLATYFKQIGCTGAHNGHLLDRCATFNTKDKTRFSVFGKSGKRERVLTHRSHNLIPQHYYAVTNCNFCQSILFGVGIQGYQCQKCDQNFHKNCLEKLKDLCSGRKSKPPNVFDKFISKKPSSSEEPVEDDIALLMESRMERTTSMPSIRDVGKSTALSYKPSFSGFNFWDKARGHKDSSMKGMERSDSSKPLDDVKSFAAPVDAITSDVLSNEEHNDETTEISKSPPPYYTSSVVLSVPPYSSVPPDGPPSYSSLQIPGDSELDVEHDLPPLEAIIPKEHLRKLDKKEKKRQEVINELFYTEKTHLRDTKVMQLLFYSPMMQEPSLVELANVVFPNINEIVEFHSNLSNEFQQTRNASSHHIVGDFADILVTNFSGEKGNHFKKVCGQFCERQSQAQEQLKAQQRKDPKLVALLQTAASNPHCRRLTLKDFLPIPMQRLTKYPLLIENLMKYTPTETEEHCRLQAALGYSREILLSVNKTVNDYQNRLKLAEIERKLDTRSLDASLKEYKNLSLSEHVLLHDGLLLWRIRRDRVIPIHVVLLDSLLLLLQKQDDKLVLRGEHMAITGKEDRRKLTHSPVIRLTNVLVRLVATDKCAFFLINLSDSGSQIYDLIASSKDEKNRWCKYINNAVEAIGIFPVPHIPMHPTDRRAEEGSAEPSQSEKHEGLGAIDDEDEDGAESAEQHTATNHKTDDETSGLHRNEASDFEGSIDSNSSANPIELLKQIDDVIRQKMHERLKIWSQLWHESDNDDDRSELFKDPSVRKHLFQTLNEANQMMCLVNNQCTAEGSETTGACSPTLCSTPQPDTDSALHGGDGVAVSMMEGLQVSFPLSQIVELNNSIQRHLMLILESVMRTDEERRKLYLDLQSVQSKIAFLTLSSSHSQHAVCTSNQTLEPVSETAEDFDGTTDVSVSSDSKTFDSEPVGKDISCANQIYSKITTDEFSANEISDAADISLTLDSEFSDFASSTDA